MRRLEIVNAVFAFVTECGLLVAAILVGARLPAPFPVPLAAAVLLPALVVAVWAVALAPRAAGRRSPSGRLVLQVVLFALAAAGLAAVGLVPLAICLAVAAAARLSLGGAIGAI